MYDNNDRYVWRILHVECIGFITVGFSVGYCHNKYNFNIFVYDLGAETEVQNRYKVLVWLRYQNHVLIGVPYIRALP